MKKLLRVLSIGLSVIVLALAAVAFEVARFGGVFTGIDPGFAGGCAALPLAGSAEDIRIDRERGVAYLSYLDRASVNRGEAVNGTVMLIDLNTAEPAVRAAMAYDPEGFRPHGISLLKRPNTPMRLFAISHRADGTHTVEIAAEAASGGLFPRETIRNDAFVNPNAIAAIGPRQFYLANGSAAHTDFASLLEVVFRRGVSTLVYYDGSEARIADTGLKFPAGLALNADTTRLYVGEALAKALRVYQRDLATGALTLEETVPLDTAPDNLEVDDEGVVWIAAHPKLLAFFAHARDPARHAPTQVLRFDPRGPKPADGEKDTRLTQVYLNAGEQISAGTVAAPWRNEFLVGALLDHKVLICKPNP